MACYVYKYIFKDRSIYNRELGDPQIQSLYTKYFSEMGWTLRKTASP